MYSFSSEEDGKVILKKIEEKLCGKENFEEKLRLIIICR